jgi:hypothetical protein
MNIQRDKTTLVNNAMPILYKPSNKPWGTARDAGEKLINLFVETNRVKKPCEFDIFIDVNIFVQQEMR